MEKLLKFLSDFGAVVWNHSKHSVDLWIQDKNAWLIRLAIHNLTSLNTTTAIVKDCHALVIKDDGLTIRLVYNPYRPVVEEYTMSIRGLWFYVVTDFSSDLYDLLTSSTKPQFIKALGEEKYSALDTAVSLFTEDVNLKEALRKSWQQIGRRFPVNIEQLVGNVDIKEILKGEE